MSFIKVKNALGAILNRLSDNDGTSESNPAMFINKPFHQAVVEGDVPGYSSVNKFGHNSAATSGDDVWGGGGTYDFYPTTGQAVSIVSTLASDTSAGTGARTVNVKGLDENWEEATETVTLNGTTPVALTNTYIRMFRAIVLTAGTGETNAGNITVENAGGDVAIYIEAGDGQTQQAIYTVPAGKSAYFVKGYTGLADDDRGGEVAEFQWQVKLNNGADTGAWAVKGEIGLNSVGTSNWTYEYGIPTGPIPEKTDIRITVITTTATLGVVGGFDLLLKDD